ncbi:hypothetical protein BS17DRAFT_766730 [Gyrodon lividus]|nr:hypothetical protein BS17DRAFT_766730 [Gyrodon lividus]
MPGWGNQILGLHGSYIALSTKQHFSLQSSTLKTAGIALHCYYSAIVNVDQSVQIMQEAGIVREQDVPPPISANGRGEAVLHNSHWHRSTIEYPYLKDKSSEADQPPYGGLTKREGLYMRDGSPIHLDLLDFNSTCQWTLVVPAELVPIDDFGDARLEIVAFVILVTEYDVRGAEIHGGRAGRTEHWRSIIQRVNPRGGKVFFPARCISMYRSLKDRACQ